MRDNRVHVVAHAERRGEHPLLVNQHARAVLEHVPVLDVDRRIAGLVVRHEAAANRASGIAVIEHLPQDITDIITDRSCARSRVVNGRNIAGDGRLVHTGCREGRPKSVTEVSLVLAHNTNRGAKVNTVGEEELGKGLEVLIGEGGVEDGELEGVGGGGSVEAALEVVPRRSSEVVLGDDVKRTVVDHAGNVSEVPSPEARVVVEVDRAAVRHQCVVQHPGRNQNPGCTNITAVQVQVGRAGLLGCLERDDERVGDIRVEHGGVKGVTGRRLEESAGGGVARGEELGEAGRGLLGLEAHVLALDLEHRLAADLHVERIAVVERGGLGAHSLLAAERVGRDVHGGLILDVLPLVVPLGHDKDVAHAIGEAERRGLVLDVALLHVQALEAHAAVLAGLLDGVIQLVARDHVVVVLVNLVEHALRQAEHLGLAHREHPVATVVGQADSRHDSQLHVHLVDHVHAHQPA
mmetsp:Transcript_40430/g.62188  ORF Transcript_40430/g.62188 Transcript_40430/m.62188 type:complete len:465 (+) Transcript_40430:1311-2705(+)